MAAGKWHTARSSLRAHWHLGFYHWFFNSKWQRIKLMPGYCLVWPPCSLVMKSFIDPRHNCYPLDCCKVAKSANEEQYSHFKRFYWWGIPIMMDKVHLAYLCIITIKFIIKKSPNSNLALFFFWKKNPSKYCSFQTIILEFTLKGNYFFASLA